MEMGLYIWQQGWTKLIFGIGGQGLDREVQEDQNGETTYRKKKQELKWMTWKAENLQIQQSIHK